MTEGDSNYQIIRNNLTWCARNGAGSGSTLEVLYLSSGAVIDTLAT